VPAQDSVQAPLADHDSSAQARLADQVDPSWLPALAPVAGEIEALEGFLRSERAAGRPYLPRDADVLRAFTQPFDDVRVLLVGQDPYPTPGHAVGLAFSVAPEVTPLPRSLRNVFTELVDDVGVPMPATGDLTPWTRSGVLLLNRVLTVGHGAPGSHRGKGWERVTDRAVAALAARGGPLVAVLWGKDAQAVRLLLDGVPIVESVHPSPLSASRGFFGSRPFSRASRLLESQGGEPVDWRLP
jgi:uracil-DNA glycosylase